MLVDLLDGSGALLRVVTDVEATCWIRRHPEWSCRHHYGPEESVAQSGVPGWASLDAVVEAADALAAAAVTEHGVPAAVRSAASRFLQLRVAL